MQSGEAIKFTGMVGSVDCCKWIWKNYLTAYHGQHKRMEKVSTTTMETLTDGILYIWHFFFRISGLNNNLTIPGAS